MDRQIARKRIELSGKSNKMEYIKKSRDCFHYDPEHGRKEAYHDTANSYDWEKSPAAD